MRDVRRPAPADAPHSGLPSPYEPGLLTAAYVAQLLGVPTSWVYDQARSGRIPTVTLGRYRRFRRQAIEAWIKSLEERPGSRQSAAA